jgi:inner membrane protein
VFMYGIYLLRRQKYAARYAKLPPRWGLLFAYAYIASLTHILLDFTNNYGVRPFWPFSGRWYSWDIVFIIEPVMLVLLAAGLVLPGLFALIHEEIGAKQQGPPGRVAATAALIGVIAMWGVRDYEHRRAIAALTAQTYHDEMPWRASAYPYWVNPFRWYGLVETANTYARAEVDSLGPEVDPRGQMRIRPKSQETPAAEVAKKTYLGQVYWSWAQYPVTETEQLESGGYLVRFKDLRYDYPDRSGASTLGASVELDRDLRVVAERFGRSRQGVGRSTTSRASP